MKRLIWGAAILFVVSATCTYADSVPTFTPASKGVPANYQFSQGNFVATTVPEPGTLGLMATGLAGIIGVIRRKRNCDSPITSERL